MTFKMKRFVVPVLMMGLLAGLFPAAIPQPHRAFSGGDRQADGVCQKRCRCACSTRTGCWPATPATGTGAPALAGATDLESRVSLAMVNTHPSESVASRRAGLDKLKSLLPELGLDAQAFLRSWIALGEELLVRDSRRDDQSQGGTASAPPDRTALRHRRTAQRA